MVGIPERAPDWRGPDQHSPRPQEFRELSDEFRIVLNVLEDLVAVDEIELSRSGRDIRKNRAGNGPRKRSAWAIAAGDTS